MRRHHPHHPLDGFLLLVTTATLTAAAASWLLHPVDGFSVLSSSMPTTRRRTTRYTRHENDKFLYPSPHHVPPTSRLFLASASDNDGSNDRDVENGDGVVDWTLRNDFDTFLNQCSIQSFLFLLQNLRDGNSALWMDQFTQPAIADDQLPHNINDLKIPLSEKCKLLHYHGLAALNMTLFPSWDTYFGQLLEQPMVTYTIKSDRSYIKDYELEINPASLCSRVLSVREQIAREFVNDLAVIANMGTKAMQRYHLENRRKRRRDDDETTTGSTTRLGPTPPPTQHDQGHQQQEQGGEEERLLEREDLMFLELPTSANGGEPSPLRKGNFDLLLLLVTQESIHRVLNDCLNQEKDKASRYYLQNFYAERLFSHFVGNQKYGRADDFMEALMWQGPRLVLHHPTSSSTTPSSFFRDGKKKKNNKDNNSNDDDPADDHDFVFSTMSALVDPFRLVQQILDQRQQVALEWKERATEVPFQHMSIKRMQLNLLLGRPANVTESSFM